MSVTFSTKLVPAADRIDAWEWNARQFCGDCRFHFPNRRAFQGFIESKKVAGFHLSLFSSSSLSFQKFPIERVHPDSAFCTAITQLEGVRRYSQRGTEVVLNPGDSTIIDSTMPWSSDCQGECVRLYLRAPRPFVENRFQSPNIPGARRVAGTSTLGAILSHIAISLYRQADQLSYDEGAAMVAAYFDIVSACMGHECRSYPGFGHTTDLHSRVERFIEEHLGEPGLDPSAIAAGVGISSRHLHRLFAHNGRTVGSWIRELRLDRISKDLADPRQRARSITDIAFSWGFCESAHFSRSFKERYGVSPRCFRNQTGLCNGAQAPRRIDGFLASNAWNSQVN